MITLYTTHCPKCNVLKEMLDTKNIAYQINDNIDDMTEKGFMSAPVLEIDDNCLEFRDAINWVNNYLEDSECTSCKIG